MLKKASGLIDKFPGGCLPQNELNVPKHVCGGSKLGYNGYSHCLNFRWSQGLLFHQAMVDCARAAILLPLGSSILNCQPVHKCSLVETAFLLLVTVSTVNMLTTVLNDSPVFPESDEEADLTAPLLMDSPQVIFLGVIDRLIKVTATPNSICGNIKLTSQAHF